MHQPGKTAVHKKTWLDALGEENVGAFCYYLNMRLFVYPYIFDLVQPVEISIRRMRWQTTLQMEKAASMIMRMRWCWWCPEGRDTLTSELEQQIPVHMLCTIVIRRSLINEFDVFWKKIRSLIFRLLINIYARIMSTSLLELGFTYCN